MSRADGEREELADWSSDRDVWRRSCRIDAPEDEAARFLDLAAFADGLLDPDENDRLASLLAANPSVMDDVAAAQGLRSDEPPARLERIIARACAILPEESNSRVIAFTRPRPRQRRIVRVFAQWGSLAAAIVIASWLGFAMGSDVSRTLSGQLPSGEASFLPELFDPGGGLLHDLGEILRT
jgi:anti-sigma factor RsiW